MIKVLLGELLEARGITVDQVAQATGIERPMLVKFLAGRTSIGLHSLDRLCEYLEVEPGDLLKREPGPQPDR